MEKDVPSKWSLKGSKSNCIHLTADFKPKLVRRHKEGYFIFIKRTIQQKGIIVNINSLNVGIPNFIK
jgi:hypothetical protein